MTNEDRAREILACAYGNAVNMVDALKRANLLRPDDDLAERALKACKDYAALIDRQLEEDRFAAKQVAQLMREPAAVLNIGRESLARKRKPTLREVMLTPGEMRSVADTLEKHGNTSSVAWMRFKAQAVEEALAREDS